MQHLLLPDAKPTTFLDDCLRLMATVADLNDWHCHTVEMHFLDAVEHAASGRWVPASARRVATLAMGSALCDELIRGLQLNARRLDTS